MAIATATPPSLPRAHRFAPEGRGFRVFGVPVFADHKRTVVHPKTGNRVVLEYTRNDLERIAQRMNRRLSGDGFKQAVHGDHTDIPGRHKRLSYACNYRVEHYVFEDGPRWIVVCDWIARDRNALLALEDFPYRSVEVNPATGEFSSIAVMESEGPHFKFPLFQLADVPEDWRAEYEQERASANYADDELILYREEKEGAMPESPAVPPTPPAAPPPVNYGAPPTGVEAPVTMAVLEQRLQAFEAKIMAAIQGAMQEPDGDEGSPVDPVVNHRDHGISKEYVDGGFARYRAEVERLAAAVDQMASRDELHRLIAEADEATKECSVPRDFHDEIAAIYREDKVKGVRRYLQGFTKSTPPSSLNRASAEPGAPEGGNLPDALVPYRGDREKLREARVLYEEYGQQPRGLRHQMTVEQYIESNLDA